MSNFTRIVVRKGLVQMFDLNGERITKPDPKGTIVKSKDGWWTGKQAELAERNLQKMKKKRK